MGGTRQMHKCIRKCWKEAQEKYRKWKEGSEDGNGGYEGKEEEKYEGKEKEKYDGKEEDKNEDIEEEKYEGEVEEKYGSKEEEKFENGTAPYEPGSGEGKEEEKYENSTVPYQPGKEEEKHGGKEEDKYEGEVEEKFENGTTPYEPGSDEGKEEGKYENSTAPYEPVSDEGKEEGKYENSTAPYQPGADEEGKQEECVFTVDCLTKVKRCKEKSCRCVFGKCHHHEIEQYPRDKHQDDECNTYKDCECKSDPKNCFCQGYKSNKKCLNEAWECHQDPAKNLSMAIPWVKIFQESPVECAALEKCKGKKCSCHFLNTCENECDNPEDCKRKYSYMSTPPGHHWKCDWGICQEIKKENNGSKEEKYEGKEEEKYEGKEEKK